MNRRRLVVVVPALDDQLSPWEILVERMKCEPGYEDECCSWVFLQHGARWFSRRGATECGSTVAAKIHMRWVADGGYDEVVLVGHSFGGLLVRYAYMDALGVFDQSNTRPWASAVDRVVLFASLNRGVEPSRSRRWWLPTAAWLGRTLPPLRRSVAHDLLRASDFITGLRIAWLRQINMMDSPPLMTQFLGDQDGLVTEDDSRDVDNFPTGTQQLVPDATHSNLIRLDVAPDPDARFALIASAFTAVRPATAPEIGDPNQTVVLILHGIRARNDSWAGDLAELIKERSGFRAIPATYGRFSARKFVFPPTRRKFIGWMQCTYADELANNPLAKFSFVGHSNGTYLLGQSLKAISTMQFERIFLAGSVLPSEYDWQARAASGQFLEMRNDRASRDVPVGILCSALNALRMRDVGTGGVDGFNWESPLKREVYYYDGGHSAALDPQNLQHLANYVLDGVIEEPKLVEASGTFGFLSRSARYASWILVGVLLLSTVSFAILGPWTLPINLLCILGVLGVVFYFLDVF